MSFISSMAEGAGEAITNKILSRPARKENVFTRLFRMVKALLDDPENMELTVTVESGVVKAKVKPDKAQPKGFMLDIYTFDNSL